MRLGLESSTSSLVSTSYASSAPSPRTQAPARDERVTTAARATLPALESEKEGQNWAAELGYIYIYIHVYM